MFVLWGFLGLFLFGVEGFVGSFFFFSFEVLCKLVLKTKTSAAKRSRVSKEEIRKTKLETKNCMVY